MMSLTKDFVMVALGLFVCGSVALSAQPIDIGSRLELFVDDYLIDSMSGAVQLQLHRPTRREIVFETDAPWEGNASVFNSVFQDGDLYRMYYRGWHITSLEEYNRLGKKYRIGGLCYAESDDGIHWRRPELNIHPWKSKPSNLLVRSGGHDAVFMDTNPDCPPHQKYKIVEMRGYPDNEDRPALFWMGSADGIHFSRISNKPFIWRGYLDSQNIAFWDPAAGLYREYHRDGMKVTADSHWVEIMKGEKGAPWYRDKDVAGPRAVRTSTSKDLFSFPEPAISNDPRNPHPSRPCQGEYVEFPGAPIDGLYMSNIQPYYRAPHILMGFPARYVNRGWSEPWYDLPGAGLRLARVKRCLAVYGKEERGRGGLAITDTLFMTSRNGKTFKRWPEAFLRPGPREKGSWVYGDNYIHWGMVETKSTLEDAPNEISMYVSEDYWEGESTSFRRLTLRLDGFVSAHASLAGGDIVTKPIRFEGGNLTLNLETSAAGGVQVEIQDVKGEPIDGYALEDCPPIYCDRIAQVVRWNKPGGDVRPLSGKPVRLRFVLKDADLYSFQFVPYAPDPKRASLPGIP